MKTYPDINLSREARIVLELCKGEIFHNRKDYLNSLLNENIDWVEVIQIIKLEGLSHIFYNNVSKLDSPKIPAPLLEELKTGYYYNFRQNAILLNESGKVIRQFADRQIPSLALKGAALAETVYKNIGLRGMSDVDILIRHEDMESINEILNNLGYSAKDNLKKNIFRSVTPYLNTYSYQKEDCPLSLHLHWHIINSTLPTHSHIFKVDMNKIWDNAIRAKIGNADTLVLAPHHLIIHLSEHGLRIRHSFDRLILLFDIAISLSLYADSIDWEKLVDDSISFNLDRMVYHALNLSKEYFDITAPDHVLNRLRPAYFNMGEKIFISMAMRNRRIPGASYAIHFAINRGFTEKVKFIFRTLSPPKIFMDQRSYMDMGLSPFRRMGEVMMYLIEVLFRRRK